VKNKKALVLSVLLIAALAVWLPTLFGLGTQGAAEESPSSDAYALAEDASARAAPSTGPSAAQTAALPEPVDESTPISPTPDPAGLAVGSDPLTELDRLEEILLHFQELEAAPTLEEESRAATGPVEGIPRIESGLLGGRTGPSPRDELDEWLLENPLQGILHDAERPLALLGHRVVRAGDALAGGRIRVAEIAGTWVRLECAGQEAIVELPPFQARSSSDDSSTSAPGATSPDAPAQASRAPLPTAAPAPGQAATGS
jgi:hypothetical protein